jgi:hypothetical protein
MKKKRAEWNKGVESSSAAAEKVLERFPESPEVALALQNLLATQRMQLRVKLKTDADVDQYFQQLAKRFEDKPARAARSSLPTPASSRLRMRRKPSSSCKARMILV